MSTHKKNKSTPTERGSDRHNSMPAPNRRLRKRQRQPPIREESSHSSQRQGKPSVMVPLIILAMCLVTFVRSPGDFFRRHRTLLTLSKAHVNQYPFSNFLEVDEFDPIAQKKVVGMYWQVPRCGGTTLKHILGTCLRRTAAARTSADYCDMNSDQLQTCQTKVGTFVNADPSDHGGIQRCERMGLIQSGIPDVIVSSRILHAATLYDPDHKGRLFTILRNPIDRAVSTFYYLQNAYWERHYRPELKEMTILDYAALPDTANNWMTRWLTGKNAEPHLTMEDLEFAKELLRRKFLIMLTEDMATSVERLLYYMNWQYDDERFEETRTCLLANTKKNDGQNRNKHLTPEEGSPEYEALMAINDLDYQLYVYATELFKAQGPVIMERKNFRSSELFVAGGDSKSDAIGIASQSSEYEAALAAAASMERPPAESTMKSLESTNNLVASALMIKMPNRTSSKKDESVMIAAVMAKRQVSANKWHQNRGVAVPVESFGDQTSQSNSTQGQQDHAAPNLFLQAKTSSSDATKGQEDYQKPDAAITSHAAQTDGNGPKPEADSQVLQKVGNEQGEMSGTTNQQPRAQMAQSTQQAQPQHQSDSKAEPSQLQSMWQSTTPQQSTQQQTTQQSLSQEKRQ